MENEADFQFSIDDGCCNALFDHIEKEGPEAKGKFAYSAKSQKCSKITNPYFCLLYTSDAADDMQCVDLGGRRIIKKIFF